MMAMSAAAAAAAELAAEAIFRVLDCYPAGSAWGVRCENFGKRYSRHVFCMGVGGLLVTTMTLTVLARRQNAG